MTSSKSSMAFVAGIAAVGTIGGGLITVHYTTQHWLDPFVPAVIMACVGVVITIINVLLAHPGGEASFDFTALRPVLVTSGLISVVGIAAGGAWALQTVRSKAVHIMADRQNRVTTLLALDDRSTAVSADACQRLFHMGLGPDRQRMVSLLDDRPAVAQQCLPAVSSVPEARELNNVVSLRWYRDAMATADDDPQHACQIADTVSRLPATGHTRTPSLLTCALTAPSDQVRACCADALMTTSGTGPGLARTLGESIDSTLARDLGPSLLRASFHQLQMSPADKQRASQMGLTDPEIRRFTARVACGWIEATDEPYDWTAHLAAWVGLDQCGADQTVLHQDVRGWKQICGELAGRLDTAVAPGDAICEEAHAYLRNTAVRAASERVHAAVQSVRHGRLSPQIVSGAQLLSQYKDSEYSKLEDYLQRVGNSRAAGSTMLPARMRMMFNKIHNAETREKVRNMTQPPEWDDFERSLKLARKNADEQGLDSEMKQKLDEAIEKLDSADVEKDEYEELRKKAPTIR